METPQKFRSAFNGFHREDVVQYLQFLNAKHQSQVNQLNMELDALRTQVETMADTEPSPDPGLLAQLEELKSELDQRDARLEELTQALAESQAQQASLRDRLAQSEAQRQHLEEQQQTQAPLDTYRHAETMERESRARAELVYYQTSGVLNKASTQVDEAAQEITTLADQATEALTRLQMALSGSKHTLQDAAAMMKSIRPNS